MVSKKIGTGSADYEAVFHYVASTEWNWKSSKCHTGNKRLRVEGKKAYCDDRIIAIFDPARELVVVNHQWDGTNYVNWYVKHGIRRAFEHWKILDVDAVTVKDAEIALKVAIHKYQTRTSRAYMYDCSESLIHYSSLCEFLKVNPKESLVKEYKEAKKKWTDKSDKYYAKKRKAEEEATARSRANYTEQLEKFKSSHPIPEGSYSQKLKFLKEYRFSEEERGSYSAIAERYYYGGRVSLSDRAISSILDCSYDGVWYEVENDCFRTSRGVTVDVTPELLRLIQAFIDAKPEQRNKFIDRHVGTFVIRGHGEDHVIVGCHRFLISDLPPLLKEVKDSEGVVRATRVQKLHDSIKAYEEGIKNYKKCIETAKKELTLLLKDDITETV